MGRLRTNKSILITAVTVVIWCETAWCSDLVFEGIYEAALDLPRILFLLKRDANGPPLEYEGQFELNWAFLDTGASGLLLSRETVDALEISLESNAQYVDVGVGGEEYFDVSEPLYIGTVAYDDPDPNDPNRYLLNPQWRFQVSREYAEFPMEPLDLIGMPAMAGKVVILDPTKLSTLEDYFIADIKEPNNPAIPPVDISVALRFEKFINPENPDNIPPLPVLAYNPLIMGIRIQYDGSSSTGDWLLDTGGMVSLCSYEQAYNLGLMDENGVPLVPVDFTVPIGGIGGEVNLPGFQIDSLSVPTLNGYDIVFQNARICVQDIGIIDASGQELILDGVFGSNFLCPSMNLMTWDLSDTPFNRIVIDMREGTLSFDVKTEYTLPPDNPKPPFPAGDINRDWSVDLFDLQIIAAEWLNSCNWLDFNCRGADMNLDHIVNMTDYAQFGANIAQ
jgi:hypothetical protein